MSVLLPLGKIQPLYSRCSLNNFLISYFSETPRSSFYHYTPTTKIFWCTFSISSKIHAKFTCKTGQRRTNSHVIQQNVYIIVYIHIHLHKKLKTIAQIPSISSILRLLWFSRILYYFQKSFPVDHIPAFPNRSYANP